MSYVTKRTITSQPPFGKSKENLKILWKQSLHSMMQKESNRKKNHTKSLSPVFLTFVFKESFYDLILFLRSNRFGGITVLPERVTVKLLELSHLGGSSLFSFASLGAGVGVSTRCPLFLRRTDWSVLTPYDLGSGDFCTDSRGALVCHPNFVAWF